MGLTLMEGNEAIAWGALAAGCRFFAGYPITPATTIYNTMLRLLPPNGGICLQGEDEIASIGFCLGASMAGLKAMTATSGPGMSLYSEQISFALGSEIPIVIVDVQRLGPSTGSATKGADGDIQFLQWGNSGGLPVIVLAPVDVKDCYVLTMQAFNLAERFRCPVFLAANKEVSMIRETLDLERLRLPEVLERRMADGREPFLPFAAREGRYVPDFLPIGGQTLVRQTSSTHGPDGYITTDPNQIALMQARRFAKISTAASKITCYDEYPVANPDTLVIAYGVTARAARAAVKRVEESGGKAGLLVLKTLWPVPEALIREKAAPCRRVIVPEMNLGQYVREIERILPGKTIDFIGQMNGELITPGRIQEVIQHG
ncbi:MULTISPECIES: transketolase C-terminal domain-containing protein [Desulfococcus]|jgi:2-oxoglutarate ferredoxin oxidoreductase subunit alpha|uniref:Pyruvate flavodoxin/ferredoxin oxidoreductase domain protein n=1 Tax=Desulfococcus multivorans DSM 2059 TaxID=1121405 RepID=S7UUQ3_DESML|nr:transketolase C-terminal domain-containing protein [Desulfococcus multivorans]AOY58268.1 KorA3: 2-oxoglutarate synthase, subunit alpha [Desulfococcus multivorans]AQV00611.1 pyruvate flavodoxin/ferredoxin oxidoreductase [Desulfococcus multivorans]EPR37789.1 pyruvate flavodoxin/ferredoxin oxidoreductase domain protein [Desulfococcus multivorans DSM 2059]MDX9818298.1 pyruvate flavodoxin/ferredoxin oxidoreductase [Desulfococcus multivorans]SJZ97842.1 2-oxoglutarate ferredoxin oxidoreductase sub